MHDHSSPLLKVIHRLETRSKLGGADREALLGMPCTVRTLNAGAYFVRDGDVPEHCGVLLSGFAHRNKITGDGARQIISIHMPTEFIDLQNVFLDVSDHNVQMLTAAEIVLIPRAIMRELALTRPAIGRALWIDSLIDAAIFREWVVNVGRRDSRTRISHLLCEFSLRLESHGLASSHRYELPMTQEQLADAVGLTPVHVNRVLKMLEQEGLISRDKRVIVIEDWQRLREAGDFNARYLHQKAIAG